MNDLITIICNRHESLEKKIQKLKEYLTDDRKIVIERELFSYQNPLLTEQIRNITNSFNSSTGNIDNKITQNIFK